MNGTQPQTLEVRNLDVSLLHAGAGPLKLIDDVSLAIGKGDVVGIVGESGCGKTLTALSIIRLLPDPPIRVTGGEILFKGGSLLKKKSSEMNDLRGKEISMIFQEHMTALDPVMPVGKQVMEVFQMHLGLNRHHARTRTVELFKMVGIPDAPQRIDSYPHELSGGMCQRVVIAMAIACNPSLIIADEPTTALDVTIQAQVLDLLQKLQEDFNTSMLFISHDLGVVAHIASRIYVMYSGQIVEQGSTEDIFSSPLHPYTLALIGSVPRLEDVALGRTRLSSIRGKPPEAVERLQGCRYAPRCEFEFDRCWSSMPPLYRYSESRLSRCYLIAPPEEKGLQEEAAPSGPAQTPERA
jgi:peptide/nickel transport system ATP-binding protein